MTSELQKLIKQAEDDTWQRVNHYKTLIEAITYTKTQVFSICLAERIINYCIENSNPETNAELIERLKKLTNK